jgi:flagellar hook-length control protein FliK
VFSVAASPCNQNSSRAASGQTVSDWPQALQSDEPKALMSRLRTPAHAAASVAKLAVREQAVGAAAEKSLAPAFELQDQFLEAFSPRGPRTTLPAESEAPMSAASAFVPPPALGVSGSPSLAQSVLRQIESEIKSSGVPAALGVSLHGGQASALKFKLRPEEFGEVTVTMRVRNERVFVDVSVDNVLAYDALMREGEEMSAKLAALGLQVSQVTIQNAQTGSSPLGQNPQESSSSHRHDSGQRFESGDAPREQHRRSHAGEPDPELEYGRSNGSGPPNSDELKMNQKFLYV